MKNRIYFLIIIVAILCFGMSLVSCSDSGGGTGTESSSGAQSSSQDREPNNGTDASNDGTGASNGEDGEGGASNGGDNEDPIHRHTEEIIPAVSASCTQAGMTEGKKCSECGMILVAQTVVEATGHRYNDEYICIACGDALESSEGLAFVYDRSTDTYYVGGIGTCSDKEIVVPYTYEGKAVTGIGHSAFADVTSITGIVLPDSVEFIYGRAFQNCSSLSHITIGKSLNLVGEYAFDKATSLTRVNYNGELKDWFQLSFNNGMDNPLSYGADFYVKGELVTELVVPAGVTRVNDYLFFGCSSIKTLTVGEDVEKIGKYSFYRCNELEKLNLGEGVKTVEALAFAECTSLAEVVMPRSIEQLEFAIFLEDEALKKVEYLGDVGDWCLITFDVGHYASNPLCYGAELYIGGNLLENLVIPSGITEIKPYTFAYYAKLKTVEIPNSVTSIGKSAFYECGILDEMTFGSSVSVIEADAFHNCFPQKVIYNGQLSDWCNIDFNGYSSNPVDSNTALYINSEIITEVVIPEGVTAIKPYTFKNWSKLVSVTIPSSVTSIGEGAFFECTMLAGEMKLEGVIEIGISAFNYCSAINSVIFGDGLTTIGESAFAYCSQINRIELSDALTEIGNSSFEGCSIVYAKMPTIAILCIPKGALETVVLTSGTEIPQKAFYQSKALKSITIPETLKTIGIDAFYSCDNLEEINYNAVSLNDLSNSAHAFLGAGVSGGGITLNIGSQVERIPAYLFAGAQYNVVCINTIIFKGDSACASIGNYAFYYCQELTDVIFEGESVCQSIGNKSFAECKKLTSLQLPSSITTVDYYAFENCKSIKHAEIPTSVIPYIHKSSLESLVLIDGDKIPENSFGGCRKLRSVVIAGNIKNIGEGAFRGCISLLSVTIGSRVTSISTEAFQYCSNLVEVYNLSALGITVNGSYGHGYAGAYAMVIHTSLDEESILTTTQDGYIFAINNEGKFYLMSYIGTEAELCLPEDFNGNAYAIYQYAFYENKIVTSVTVPSSIVEIGKMAFADCFFLTSVVFENTIGWSAGETDISESDLSDTTKAAEYLTETYTNYGWKCEN